MTFLWPNLLFATLLMPLVVLLYLLVLRRRKRVALKYASLAMVKEAMGSGGRWRRHVPPILFLAGLAITLVAVARPAAIITLPSQRGTIILAMDVSGSMRARDIEPSRIAAAQSAAKSFVEARPENMRIGIVAFASTALLVQSPTFEREELLAAIDRFQTQRGTAVGSGILTSLRTLFPGEEFEVGNPYQTATQQMNQAQRGAPLGQASEAEKAPAVPVPPGSVKSAVIILLTDGQTTEGPDPVEAARLAADKGVRIFTVGFGSTDGEILGYGGRSMRVQLDEETLKRISDMTRATYFHAGSETDLRKVYDQLSAQLVLEREKTEVTALFAAVAAAIFVLAALLSLLWFNRLI